MPAVPLAGRPGSEPSVPDIQRGLRAAHRDTEPGLRVLDAFAGGFKDVSRPGRLGCWPLMSGNRSHLKVASRLHQVQLIQPLVLYLLMTDVLANDRFVPSHR
jgi:hypothetical protein